MDQNGLLKNLEFWAENCDRTNTGCQAAFVLRDAKTLIEDLYAHCKRLEEARERANESAHQWEGRCKILETRLETAEKMVKEYHDVIVPGYRERAEKAERERDAAVEDISDILASLDDVRERVGIDNADSDDEISELCYGYCSNAGPMCYKRGESCKCENFKWRGQKEE